MNDKLIIAGKNYSSRLLVGTGKYKDFAETKAAIEASGAEIITIAIRRSNIGQNPNEPSLLEILPPSKYTLLPNTAGCYTADDAVRTLRLARELLDGHSLVKLEVLGDPQSLYPNVIETIAAAKTLVAEGFQVMVYTSDDPIIAKQLEDIGCVAIMPLASLIGSGMGILNPWNLQLIMERVQVPVIVDAGVGTASDAAIAMELGCDGVLMNTAIAAAQQPVLMASAMKQAVEAGRSAFLAGRMPKKLYSASPSSPTAGIIASTRSLNNPSALLSASSMNGCSGCTWTSQGKLKSIAMTDTTDLSKRHIRSFVLRQGRVSTAQQRAIDTWLPRYGIPLRRAAARPRPGLRTQRAQDTGDRLRHGRQHGDHRAGASRERLPGAGSAYARRGQPAQADRCGTAQTISASCSTMRWKCCAT